MIIPFKVGDKVRVISDQADLKMGEIFTVTEVDVFLVSVDDKPKKSWSSFQKVPEHPSPSFSITYGVKWEDEEDTKCRYHDALFYAENEQVALIRLGQNVCNTCCVFNVLKIRKIYPEG